MTHQTRLFFRWLTLYTKLWVQIIAVGFLMMAAATSFWIWIVKLINIKNL